MTLNRLDVSRTLKVLWIGPVVRGIGESSVRQASLTASDVHAVGTIECRAKNLSEGSRARAGESLIHLVLALGHNRIVRTAKLSMERRGLTQPSYAPICQGLLTIRNHMNHPDSCGQYSVSHGSPSERAPTRALDYIDLVQKQPSLLYSTALALVSEKVPPRMFSKDLRYAL